MMTLSPQKKYFNITKQLVGDRNVMVVDVDKPLIGQKYGYGGSESIGFICSIELMKMLAIIKLYSLYQHRCPWAADQASARGRWHRYRNVARQHHHLFQTEARPPVRHASPGHRHAESHHTFGPDLNFLSDKNYYANDGR